MRLSVVIPVLNDAGGLRRCLDSIRADAGAGVEVIVADNGSTDGSREVAAQGGAAVMELPGLRVGEMRNRAAGAAAGELLAFVDADHELLPGWFEAAAALSGEEGVAGVGAPCLAPEGGTWVQRMYGRLRGRQVGRTDVDWLGSGNLVVRRDVFERLGGFDTALEVCEDVDLCQRIRSAGWRLVGDERLRSVHFGDPATLGALFRGELWRGRDNLRVSLRRPTLGGLPSVLIPVVGLASLAAAAAGLALLPWHGLPFAVAGLAVVLALATLRAARILARPGSRSATAAAQALAVAITYDLARALALVLRPRHRRAR